MTAKERHYKLLRSRGFSPEDATRLAHGNWQCAIQTEATFVVGFDKDPGYGDPLLRKQRLAAAEAAGVSTTGKVFVGGICRQGMADDPLAWVSESSAKSEITKRCHEEGWGCKGSINIAPRDLDGPNPLDEKPFLADDLVAEAADAVVEELGEPVSPKERTEIEEQVRERHTPKDGLAG